MPSRFSLRKRKGISASVGVSIVGLFPPEHILKIAFHLIYEHGSARTADVFKAMSHVGSLYYFTVKLTSEAIYSTT